MDRRRKRVVLLIKFVITVGMGATLSATALMSLCAPQQAPVQNEATELKNGNSIMQDKEDPMVMKSAPYHKLAVIVPYRDRFEELMAFVPYMHGFLIKQDVDHKFVVVNQVDSHRFNRAALLNIGFLETEVECDYMVMHDVDLLPLNDHLSYAYPRAGPFHVAASGLHPMYNYKNFVGGILIFTREQFRKANGLSTKYWGWGREDDEFFYRMKDAGLTVSRPIGITTGIKDTFRHIHGSDRKRDNRRYGKQKQDTRKRDRVSGLKHINYSKLSVVDLTINRVEVTVINVKLPCNYTATPWCDEPTAKLPQKPKNSQK